MVSQNVKFIITFIGISTLVILIGYGIVWVFDITYDDNNCIGTWKNGDFSDKDTCMIFYENRSGNFIMKDVSYPFTWKPTFGRSYDIYFINGYKTDISISIYGTFFYTLSHDSYIEFYKSKSEESS